MEDFDLEEASPGGGAGWMATFADMMTLLLTFFVLLLSFATMDIVKFRMMLGSVKDAFGVQYEQPGELEAKSTTLIPFSDQEATPQPSRLEELAILEEVQRTIQQQGLEELVEAELGERGVVVRVKDRALYALGSAELRPEAENILNEMVQLCNRLNYPIMVEGHTDNLPIHTAEFPSNWELSTARAISAMRYFVDSGLPPGRVGVAGYADVRPLAPNDSEANRAKNRRVEFIFIRMDDDAAGRRPPLQAPAVVEPIAPPAADATPATSAD